MSTPFPGAHSGGKLGSTLALGPYGLTPYHSGGKLGATVATPHLPRTPSFFGPDCPIMSNHVYMSSSLFLSDEPCWVAQRPCRLAMSETLYMGDFVFMGAGFWCPECTLNMSPNIFMSATHFMGENICISCSRIMSNSLFMSKTVYMGQDVCVDCDLFMDDQLFMSTHVFMGDNVCAECRGLVVTNLKIDRADEGPQLLLTWEPPEKASMLKKIAVVRKRFSYPQSLFDGKLIFSGAPTAGAISDIDLEECNCYYYSIFSQRRDTLTWCTNDNARIIGMPVQTGFFPQKLLTLLPELALIADQNASRADHKIVPLTLEVDPLTGERFNLLEDGVTKKGALERYLKILGLALDDAKGLINCLATQFDVETICADRLSLLAAIVGLDLNTELPIPRQRDEIKTAVDIWKIKGTEGSIQGKARAISRADVEIDDFGDNILITLTKDGRFTDRTLLSSNLVTSSKLGLLDDPNSYTIASTPETLYNPTTFGVFFKMPNGESVVFDKLVIDKIQRILDLLSPIGTTGKIILQDIPEVETVPDPDDSVFQDIIESFALEPVYNNSWLFTITSIGQFINHTTLTAASLPPRISMTLGTFKGDSFSDVITP